VQGTGPRGRIIARDIAQAKAGGALRAPGASGAAPIQASSQSPSALRREWRFPPIGLEPLSTTTPLASYKPPTLSPVLLSWVAPSMCLKALFDELGNCVAALCFGVHSNKW